MRTAGGAHVMQTGEKDSGGGGGRIMCN